MSASLVGSEMCIRDRGKSTPTSTERTTANTDQNKTSSSPAARQRETRGPKAERTESKARAQHSSAVSPLEG
eukprot:3500998-Alexandrium_andersonii.AAC.1